MIRRALDIIRKIILGGLTLAFLGTVTVWAASHVSTVWVTLYGNKETGAYFGWQASRGLLLIHTTRFTEEQPAGRKRHKWSTKYFMFSYAARRARFTTYQPGMVPSGFGFGGQIGMGEPGTPLHTGTLYKLEIGTPCVVPAILFAAYPTLAFIRGPVRRWRRSRKGLCLTCGYDLTGNVSGICSECGNAI